MRITRLELHGFKSFADRTVFQFGRGISCVVGPNGCGKSNVVDALRWCMGEQSARSLRGGEMADVIFAGSEQRKPVGYAEVVIGLATDDQQPFPGEYARFREVQVARRLYRSGASEYLINQTRVRRKDILDLFMDSGAGNDLYAFIEQGRIDKVVSASSEDRRALLDEAAGITRYLKRREEALRKLDATRGQLDRAADVVDEMGRRLRTLQRQVLQAARYRRHRALLRQDEVSLALVKLAGIQAELNESEERAREHRDALVLRESELEAAREEAESRRGEVEIAEASFEKAQEAFGEAEGARREAAARRELQTSRVEELTARAASARQEGERAREVAVRAEREVAEATQALEVAHSEGHTLQVAVDEAQAALVRAQQIEEQARDHRDQLERAWRSAREERAGLQGRREAAQARGERLPQEEARLQSRLAEAEVAQQAAARRVEAAAEAVRVREEGLPGLHASLEQAEQALEVALRADHHARDAVRRAERKLDAAQDEAQKASQAAEHTAGEAEEVIAAKVDRVRASEEGVLRQRAREDAEALAAQERALRAAVDAGDRSRREALDQHQRQVEEELAAWRAEQEGARASEDQVLAEAEDEAARLGADAVGVAEAAVEAEASRRREVVGERVSEAEARVEQARTALEDAEATRAVQARDLARQEGRLGALVAEEEAASRRDAGGEAIRAALPEAPRLLDALEDRDDPRLGLLGERLLLPVVRPEQVEVAWRAANQHGPARVVLVSESARVEALLSGVTQVDDPSEAVRIHREGRSSVALEDGTLRIDPDGLVHLGDSGEASAAVARGEEREAVAREVERLREQVAQADQRIVTCRAALEAARIGARQAVEARDGVEAEIRTLREARIQEARAEAEERVRRARQARAEARGAWKASWERAWQERVSTGRASIEARRQEVDEALEEARRQMGGELDALRAAQREASEARQREAAQRIEAARERIREEVRAHTRDVVVRREEASARVDACRKVLAKVRERAEQAAQALQVAREAHSSVEREIAEHGRVHARLQAEHDVASEQQAAWSARQQETLRELESVRAQAASAFEESSALEERWRVCVAEADKAEEAWEAADRSWREASDALAAAREARERAAEALASCRESIAANEARRVSSSRESTEAAARQRASEEVLVEASQARDEAARQAEQAREQEQGLAERCQEAGTHRESARARLKALRDARDKVEEQVGRLEQDLGELRQLTLDAEQGVQRLSMQRAQLEDRIQERHDLRLSDLLDHLLQRGALRLDPSEEAARGLTLEGKEIEPVGSRVVRVEDLEDEARVRAWMASAESCREALSKIGEVHLGALEEYEEVAARHADLEAQRADLDEGVQSIREAIAQLNDTCRTRFREAFDQVDAAFRKAYPELVGGGEARLELTDEEDLLTTGVEVFVRPPGKRLQHLALLSGGEKAMTAISLLLALFSVKPSPFCVLDEVDAPLDEANGARFNDMIQRMSAQTQFLVITHNRKTMECADTLYGITMHEPGCSSLVSVQVD